MRYRQALRVAALVCCVISLAAKKKNQDDITQTLALPKDPPTVAVGETRRLVFHVSPLSGKGLLSQQTRDALKAILKQSGGAAVIHLRAFVAGSGDIRRVPQIVSEFFTDKKMALPSVSVVLAGGLPLENAQVVVESVSQAKRDVNPGGLEFIAGEAATSTDPAAPSKPLLDKTLEMLSTRLGVGTALKVSCFVSGMSNPTQLTASIAARFPSAAVDLVQTQRAPYRGLALCEAVARGAKQSAQKLAFTGTRVAFGSQEKDAALAFQRLDRDLAEAGASPSDIVFTNIYPLSDPVAELVRKFRTFQAPVALIPSEGLASIDAGFAADAIAAVSK
jgi:enamine deaminase RidA (YjgF/YER057c/UK114 family)